VSTGSLDRVAVVTGAAREEAAAVAYLASDEAPM
jgi:hypothetical protein